MKRGLLLLVLGVLGAALAYSCFYLTGTATPRAWMRSEQPELVWLKHEFKLGEAEFQRIAQLHAGYLPQCQERCRRIVELNDRLARLLETATGMTPELERTLSERAQMRALCQAEMLQHFLAVSHTMPPEQGRRYLAWVRQHTGLHEPTMNHSQATEPAAHSH